jgi:Uma2 family endonuclease
MASLPITPLTEAQYLEIERAAETKSEFHDGQMFAMAGGSFNHSVLTGAVGGILYRQLPPGCTLSSDMRIKVVSAGLYTYPDCGIICDEPQFFGDRHDALLNPLLLVEVLSPSTECYDRGKKFELYRSIPSLREYLIVHQDQRRVEHYSKQDDGSWLLRDHTGANDSVAIPRLQVTIPLGELYANALDLAE